MLKDSNIINKIKKKDLLKIYSELVLSSCNFLEDS